MVCAVTAGLLSACSNSSDSPQPSNPNNPNNPNTPVTPFADFMRGADLSFLPTTEGEGTVYYSSSDVASDVILLLKSRGCNTIRMRLWHTPADAHSSLAEVKTLEAYAGWMKWLLSPLPDGHYELKAFAVDGQRNSVTAFATFHGTHSGQGGPIPPTGKSAHADYVYVMQFDGDKIRHMTKIWNAGWTLRELGWA